MTARQRLEVPPAVAAVCGLLVIIGALLPWYATNLGEPFSPETTTGWDATTAAKLALACGALTAAAGAFSVLALRGRYRDPQILRFLGWMIVVTAGAAFALIAFRALVKPDPAEFLSREIGIYVALAAAGFAVIAGVLQILTRDPDS
ncbi:MAG: hypothetical protein ACR2N6_00010 [Miltoncostaeaceae bacterium]